MSVMVHGQLLGSIPVVSRASSLDHESSQRDPGFHSASRLIKEVKCSAPDRSFLISVRGRVAATITADPGIAKSDAASGWEDSVP